MRATDAVDEGRYGAVTAAARAALVESLPAIERIEHVRTAHYAVFRIWLAGESVLTRVGTRAAAGDQAFELALTAHLAAAGAPVPAPVRDHPGVLTTGSHAVGLWTWQDNDPALPLDSAQVGRVLADVHRAGRAVLRSGTIPVPGFKNPDKIRRRLAALTAVCDPAVHRLLIRELDRRAAAVADLSPLLAPVGLLHGDYQPGNLLRTPVGLAVIDFETACRGPLHWDLTTLEGRCRRGEYPDLHFPSIVEGYLQAGGPAPDPAAFSVLCRLRDLSTTVWAYNEHRLAPTPARAARAERLLADLIAPPA